LAARRVSGLEAAELGTATLGWFPTRRFQITKQAKLLAVEVERKDANVNLAILAWSWPQSTGLSSLEEHRN
jgi:hypothetical protein